MRDALAGSDRDGVSDGDGVPDGNAPADKDAELLCELLGVLDEECVTCGVRAAVDVGVPEHALPSSTDSVSCPYPPSPELE